jgi:hypothetical protein
VLKVEAVVVGELPLDVVVLVVLPPDETGRLLRFALMIPVKPSLAAPEPVKYALPEALP